jgi:redox-sensing transcriptional repressor
MKGSIPRATVNRLPLYLQVLEDLGPSQSTISSEQLARAAGVNSANVRKDLSYLGSYGTRGVGYDAGHLQFQIARRLGRTGATAVAIIGAGNLGQALAGFPGFEESGFVVAGVFDSDPNKIGSEVNGLAVEAVADLDEAVKDREVAIGIITTPASSAQDVADRLSAAGVRSILNFAAAMLDVGPGVEVRRVDLSTELQILSYYLHEGR